MPMRRRAILNVKESLAELDLEIWEDRSDGLIVFDESGNFTGCSEKMQQLAGSVDRVRTAVAEFSWPGEFAQSGEPVRIFRSVMPFGRQPGQAEVRCVRTAAGFVAAMSFAQNDLLLDIFSAHIVERRAISRHLHGALTQDLVALSLSLSAMREEGGHELSEAIAHVEKCCRGVRALSY